MRKYPVFFIVALVFIGAIKLIQVTAFDATKYSKSKEGNYSKIDKKSKAKLTKKEPITPKSEDSKQEKLTAQIAKSDSTVTIVEDTIEDSNSFNAKETNDYGSLADLKNNYLALKIANLPTGQLRNDVVLRYYKHEKDGDKVYDLSDLGYYIHEKEATETAGLGSNILYYGEEVNVEDIQIVALTLLNKGIPIKSIEKSQFDWKSNSIEIGTDTLLLNSSNLSNQDVIGFSKED